MPDGPSRNASQDSYDVLTLMPFGSGGVDLFTDAANLAPEFLSRGENLRLAHGPVERRDGWAKLYQPTDVCGSKTFGTTGKYATIPTAAQLVLAKGGWGLHVSYVLRWPDAGKTAFVLSSKPSGGTFHVLKHTVSDSGQPTTKWRDSSGADREIVGSAVVDGTTVHVLALFDPTAGTFTQYVSGAASGTPITGLDSALTLDQTTGVVWAVGVEKETGAGVTADTQFTGAIDSLTLFSFAGTRPSSGDTTLAATLLRHSARQWPAPQMDSVIFNYDMDATDAMYDSSRFKNHASLVGSPTNTAAVALSSMPGNHVGSFDGPLGKRVNIFGNYGRLFFQIIRGDAA